MAANGVAIFSTVTLDQVAENYTLQATSGSLTPYCRMIRSLREAGATS